MLDISAQVNALAEQAVHRLAERERILVALAGAPGSGKSALAAAVHRRLLAQRIATEVVTLDGFHLDNTVLDARGLRARKGAPETFDAEGFLHLVQRLRAGGEVVAPLYDRVRDLSVAGALVVPAACRVVICEGSYVLLDEEPWRRLLPLWDLRARLDVPLPELRARLIQRWLDLGLSRAAATRRAEANDLANARRMQERALPAEIVLAIRPDGAAHRRVRHGL